MKKLIAILFLAFAATTSAQDLNDIYFIKLVNAHRAKNGLTPVRYNRTLDSACKLQADYQLKVNRCTHTQDPASYNDTAFCYTAGNRLDRVDANWIKKFHRYEIGENCAKWKYAGPAFQPEMRVDTAIVKKIFDMWVLSPGHNAALLMPGATVAAIEFSFSKTENYNKVLNLTSYDFKLFATCLLMIELKK
jgi:uncharacterized protein YkwD